MPRPFKRLDRGQAERLCRRAGAAGQPEAANRQNRSPWPAREILSLPVQMSLRGSHGSQIPPAGRGDRCRTRESGVATIGIAVFGFTASSGVLDQI